MEVLIKNYPKEKRIPNSDTQLRRLERNQRDIAQFFGKLGSYVCEPQTYEQYIKLNTLKETAKELRDFNNTICKALRLETNATVRCSKLLKTHLQNFDAFTKDVMNYLGEVKVHDTAHI